MPMSCHAVGVTSLFCTALYGHGKQYPERRCRCRSSCAHGAGENRQRSCRQQVESTMPSSTLSGSKPASSRSTAELPARSAEGKGPIMTQGAALTLIGKKVGTEKCKKTQTFGAKLAHGGAGRGHFRQDPATRSLEALGSRLPVEERNNVAFHPPRPQIRLPDLQCAWLLRPYRARCVLGGVDSCTPCAWRARPGSSRGMRPPTGKFAKGKRMRLRRASAAQRWLAMSFVLKAGRSVHPGEQLQMALARHR